MSCDQSGVLGTDLQAQHVCWLSLANGQKPDAYGVDRIDCMEHLVAPCATMD